jgi:hypothetical protein
MKYLKIQLFDTETKEQVEMSTPAYEIKELISNTAFSQQVDSLKEIYNHLDQELEKSNDQKSEKSREKDS